MPSFILIWTDRPFGHNTPTSQTDRQTDRQTDGQDRTWQRSDSIGRTVLQTVDPKFVSQCPVLIVYPREIVHQYPVLEFQRSCQNTHITSVGLMSPNSAKQARCDSHVDRNSTGKALNGLRILRVDSYWHHCDTRHATACRPIRKSEHYPDATC